MAQIVLQDRDPVFLAVVEDKLRLAGHEVRLAGPRRGVDVGAADLLVLGLESSTSAGLEPLTRLRERAETRTLPVLVLSERNDSASRVAALRAGAADYLAKPCDLEELELRCSRLVGARASGSPILRGELADHPVWELIQFLSHSGRSGDLVLTTRVGNGKVRLRDGRAEGAAWERLCGDEALLAVLGAKQGSFRFVPVDEAEPLAGGAVEIQEALIRAAWLEDELESRRALRPVTGAPLRPTGVPFSRDGLEEELAKELPLEPVLEFLERHPRGRSWDALRELEWAPQKVRLAILLLLEAGALAAPSTDSGEFGYPDTSEIASTLVLDLAVDEFLSAARRAGFGTSALPIVVATEPWTWPELRRLLEGIPGASRIPAVRELLSSLTGDRRSGNLQLPSELGKLVLHVLDLDAASEEELVSLLTVSVGVLLWLDDGRYLERVPTWMDRLGPEGARGMVIADQPAVHHRVRGVLEGRSRWDVSPHAPQSLLGILRLLQIGSG